MKRPEVKIVIPDLLKVKLVDDWEQVTKNNNVSELPDDRRETAVNLVGFGQLVTLPRSPTVQEIVNQYKADVLKDKGRET
jgi:mortality factor 4-like protein 1